MSSPQSATDLQLTIDPIVAKDLVLACNAWLYELGSIRRGLTRIATVSGMGTLQSGLDLAAKFSRKARGGDDSLEKSLDSHIAVVKEMRAYFQACIDRYESVDVDNADRLARHEVSGS